MQAIKAKNAPKYSIECSDFKDHADEGRWRSYDLFAEGNTLEELLDSAVYSMTDQDGGEMGFTPADDDNAQAFIAEEFRRKYQTCHCDYAPDTGAYVCDMHKAGE